jgi:hypothetical protein
LRMHGAVGRSPDMCVRLNMTDRQLLRVNCKQVLHRPSEPTAFLGEVSL